MIKGWTEINLREKSKEDLEDKLKEIDRKEIDRYALKLNEEEKALREQIIFVLNNPDAESDSFVLNNPDTESDSLNDDNDSNRTTPKESTSIEENLDILGNVVIGLGAFSCSILILFAMIEEQFFFVIWGFAGILSSLISGYILKGLSKIIILLSASQVSNNDT